MPKDTTPTTLGRPTAGPAPLDVDAVLTEFVSLGFDPLALAERRALSPLQVLDFFDRPEVAERLEKLQQLIALGEKRRDAQARAAALTAPQRIVEDDETDPIEKRRAAATILRALNKPARRKNEATPPDPADPIEPPNRATNGPPLVSSLKAPGSRHAQPTPRSPAANPKEERAGGAFLPHQRSLNEAPPQSRSPPCRDPAPAV